MREQYLNDQILKKRYYAGGGQLNNIPLQNWDFQSFWHIILNDNHPFLYNLCLKIYAHIFGTSDFVLRFLARFGYFLV
ncbi:hypothetical protein [Helicobacter typhlonius]|uniref:hypothetical protein n=1 Tax=Helicobacter typhlonius TaxID=76936 RepID=UPI002FE164ED